MKDYKDSRHLEMRSLTTGMGELLGSITEVSIAHDKSLLD